MGHTDARDVILYARVSTVDHVRRRGSAFLAWNVGQARGSSYSYRRRERDVGLRLLGRRSPGDLTNALDRVPQRPRHEFDARIQMWRLGTGDVVALAE